MSEDTGRPVEDDSEQQPATVDGEHEDEHGGEAGDGEAGDGEAGQHGSDDRVLVVTPQGVSVTSDAGDERLSGLVAQPAKVMRIGSMVKQLLEEVRTAPLDDAGRSRLAAAHARSIAELESGLAPELVAELERIALPFGEGEVPSDAELRVAQAQLVGWLEGLFHGIQTALFAQQIAARAQFEEIRRQAALPGPVATSSGTGRSSDDESSGGTGHYL